MRLFPDKVTPSTISPTSTINAATSGTDDGRNNDSSSTLCAPEEALAAVGAPTKGKDGDNDEAPGKTLESRKLWTPFFLRRATVGILLLAFVSALVAVVTLYLFSHREHDSRGIETTDRLYYLWTYGPTAVIMVGGAFWAQVEYRSCQLMPWLLMTKGSLPASESVLLDYVSDWNVVSLYKSLRRKHHLVSLAIAGSLLLNGLTIVSTSLFELRPIRIPYHTQFRATHAFNVADFDPASVDGSPYLRHAAMDAYNLDIPMGMAENYIFQPFQELSQPDRSNYTIMRRDDILEAIVDVLSVQINCVKADPDVDTTVDPFEGTELQTDDGCHSRYRIDGKYQSMANSRVEVWSEQCESGANDTTDRVGPVAGTPFVPGDWRMWAALTQKRPAGDDGDAQRFWFTSAMCNLHYNMTRGPVTYSRTPGGGLPQYDMNIDQHGPVNFLPTVSPAHILYATSRAFERGDAVWRNDKLDDANDSSLESVIELDPSDFPQKLEDIFTPIAVQMAHQSLLLEEEQGSEVSGTRLTLENRLFMRDVSFALMVAILALLISISACVGVFFAPMAVCPRDPSSIAGLAAILSQSPDAKAAFGGLSTKWPAQMRESLSQFRFQTKTLPDQSFVMQVEDKVSRPRTKSREEHDNHSDINWWRPLATRPPMYISTLVTPVVIIIISEVLYHISTSSAGIALVEGQSAYIPYTWTYIPALLMFGVRCLFRLMEFNARVFQPFYNLSRGNAPAGSSVLDNQHRKIAVYNVFDSMRKRQWALAASTIALLLAAGLPVAVSGLYDVDSFRAFTHLNVVERSRWIFGDPSKNRDFLSTFGGSSDMSIHDSAGGMIMYMNLSYPQGTYGELAFPDVQLTPRDDDKSANLSAGYVQTRIPALRGNLNCDEVPSSDYTVTWGQVPSSNGTRSIEVVVGHEKSTGHCENYLRHTSVHPRGGYFSDLRAATLTHNTTRDCMNFLYMFGKAAETNDTEAMTVLSCNPRIEQIQADARLSVPGYRLDPDFPPSILAGTEETLYERILPRSSDSSDEDSPVWVVPNPARMNALLLNSNSDRDASLADLDGLTRAALTGVGAVPAEELLADPSKLATTISRIYSIVSMQLISKWGREKVSPNYSALDPLPSDANIPGPKYSATFIDSHEHLVQNLVSTRVLNAFLAAMVVCGIISVLCLNTRQVLPKNPCSVAALASLLAESRMVTDGTVMAPGAEWWGVDKEDSEKGEGIRSRRFRMGWWMRTTPERVGEANGGVKHVFCIDVENDD